MVAVQGRVAIYKWPSSPCLCVLPGSVQHRDLMPAVSSDTDRRTGPLWSQSVITDCFYSHKGCKSNHFSFSLVAFLQPLRTTE
ncbi:unnamed protein product [Staurois parvus]|uniref:Uncharacterized protein n=1 Tax=Staurois parvus TaxID=386267 RepID=A0ABN9ENN0_9NEOB|nr:unnamed protein product [Staurois parvus]